jgi:hypothetical protein
VNNKTKSRFIQQLCRKPELEENKQISQAKANTNAYLKKKLLFLWWEGLQIDTESVFSLHSIKTFNKTAIPNTATATLELFSQLLSRKLTFELTNF